MTVMKSGVQRILCLIWIGMVALLLEQPARAEAYMPYTYDAYGDEVPAPAAYHSEVLHYGILYEGLPLSQPEDFFVSSAQKLYICDTGNDRIVILNADLSFDRTITSIKGETGELKLSKPQGIFVNAAGGMYICDTGNSRVLIADENGNEMKTPLLRPNSSLIAENVDFQPKKIVVDSTGASYVVAHGIYQGLLTYGPAGEFTGFFGSNKVELSAGDQFLLFWKELFTQEQRDAMIRFVPVEFSNVYIDAEDCVYTSTRKTSSSKDELKKLNALGENVLRYPTANTLYPANDFGDLNKTIENKQQIDSRFEDVHVDADGIVSGLDTQRSKVFQYDQDCNLLFVFGGNGWQDGLFSEPTAIEKLGENYLILDKAQGTITMLRPTDYARKVLRAAMLYNDGRYLEAQEYWEDVLKYNGYYSLAFKGIGKSLLQQGEYRLAMEYLKKAGDRESYSEAFGEVRGRHIRTYLPYYLVGGIAGLWLVIVFLKAFLRKIGVLPPKGRAAS